MPRAPDPREEKAKHMYLSGLKLVEIASQLNLPAGTVRRWKCTYKWDNERSDKKANVHNKGGQPGNKNAVGNTSSPTGNNKAEKYGFFSKYLPADTLAIIKETDEKKPIDLLWDQIQLQYAAIIRAQKIAYEKSLDMSDQANAQCQSNFLSAQSRATASLNNMIKQYDEMLKSPLATEEQKLRIEKLRAETEQIKGTDSKEAIDKLDDVLNSIKGVV